VRRVWRLSYVEPVNGGLQLWVALVHVLKN